MSGVGRGLVTAVLGCVAAGSGSLALVLAVARVTAPDARRGIELVAFTPLGLPAAVVGAAAALLLVLRRRPLAVPVLGLTVPLAVLHAAWLAPLFAGDVADADHSGPRLVVMTQNLEGGDAREVALLASRHGVDVLVLTDLTEGQVADLAATALGDRLPYSTLGHGRGSVVWSRYRISSDIHLSEGGDSRRVSLDVPGLGVVDLVAVHPTPPYHADGARWRDDWRRVLGSLRRGDEAGGRVLVVGDLNATPDHWPVRSLADLGIRDVAEQLNAGLSPTWPANGRRTRWGVSVPPLLPLDHVLTADGLVPTAQVLTDAAGSDHLGVIATLRPAAR